MDDWFNCLQHPSNTLATGSHSAQGFQGDAGIFESLKHTYWSTGLSSGSGYFFGTSLPSSCQHLFLTTIFPRHWAKLSKTTPGQHFIWSHGKGQKQGGRSHEICAKNYLKLGRKRSIVQTDNTARSGASANPQRESSTNKCRNQPCCRSRSRRQPKVTAWRFHLVQRKSLFS